MNTYNKYTHEINLPEKTVKVGFFQSSSQYYMKWVTINALHMCNHVGLRLHEVVEDIDGDRKIVNKFFGKGTKEIIVNKKYCYRLVVDDDMAKIILLKHMIKGWLMKVSNE